MSGSEFDVLLSEFPEIGAGQKIVVSPDGSGAHVELSGTLVRTFRNMFVGGCSRSAAIEYVTMVVDAIDDFRLHYGGLLWGVYTQQNWKVFRILPPGMFRYVDRLEDICGYLHRVLGHVSNLRATYTDDGVAHTRLDDLVERLHNNVVQFHRILHVYARRR